MALLPDSAAPSAPPAAAPVSTDFAASFGRLRMPFESRFFPDFFVEVRLAEAFLEVLLLVEAFVVEALLRLTVPLRFLLEAALLFLPAAFLVPFFDLRELDDPLANRPLLDFFAADRLRAFVVGMLSSSIAAEYVDSRTGTAPMVNKVVAGFPADDALANALARRSHQRATKQRPPLLEKRCLLWTTL